MIKAYASELPLDAVTWAFPAAIWWTTLSFDALKDESETSCHYYMYNFSILVTILPSTTSVIQK